MLSKLPPVKRFEKEALPQKPAEEFSGRKVEIEVHEGVYFVKSEWLLNTMRAVNFDDTESLQYFQRVLISSGTIDELRKAGINEGDTVNIYDLEFEFVE